MCTTIHTGTVFGTYSMSNKYVHNRAWPVMPHIACHSSNYRCTCFGEFTGHYLVSVIGWKIGPCSRSNGYCCIISWPDYLNTHTHIYSIYATKMNDLVCVALVSLMHNDCLHDFHRHEYLQIFKARERLLGRWFTVILYQCFSKNFAKLIL